MQRAHSRLRVFRWALISTLQFGIVQEEYEREEIDWSYIEFIDNQVCVAGSPSRYSCAWLF